MGFLLAAVTAFASFFGHSAAAAKPQTLYLLPAGSKVTAFAQDGPEVAWFASSGGRACDNVHLLNLSNGLSIDLPSQKTGNVTCTFARSKRLPVHLALAYDQGLALWTLPQASPLPLDYLLGAGVATKARAERRFLEVAHTTRGIGQWLGGIAGDGGTLVYGVTAVDFADEAGCLAGSAPCTLVRSGGGVYRIVGRTAIHVPNTGPAVSVAASAGTVAYVGTGAIAKNGKPQATADVPIEIVEAASGLELTSVVPAGVPTAIALSPHVLASLERTPLGLRLAWYDSATGKPGGSVPVPASTAPQLTATDGLIVFRVGRSLRAVDVSSHRTRVLTTVAAPPIGLSLEGRRLAWAENTAKGSRVRALYVSGSG
jgi:hypothetical protein